MMIFHSYVSLPEGTSSNPVNMAVQSAPVTSTRLSLSGETCCSAQQYSILISRTLHFHCTWTRLQCNGHHMSSHVITCHHHFHMVHTIEMVSTSQTSKPDQGARRCWNSSTFFDMSGAGLQKAWHRSERNNGRLATWLLLALPCIFFHCQTKLVNQCDFCASNDQNLPVNSITQFVTQSWESELGPAL